jgi:Zn-finger nucleic acid-binding protein
LILSCPKCEREDLVNASHGASRCNACGGLFVPSSRVQELLASSDLPADNAVSRARDEKGGRCPADKTIMARATIDLGGESGTIHLDRCGGCHGVWFDAGEWAVLSAKHLLEHIDEFWSAEWRNAQRHSLEHDQYQRRLEETFGPDLLSQIRSLATVLRGHPRRSQALALLTEESSANTAE